MFKVHIITAKDSNHTPQARFVTLSRKNALAKRDEFTATYAYTTWEKKRLLSRKGSYTLYKGEELVGALIG